jgi:hypothetical protein
MIKFLKFILDSLRELNPVVTGLLGAISLGIGVFNFMNELWGHLVAKLATLTLPTPLAATVISGFGFVDWCFPFSELCTFITAWAAVFLICTAVRMIKSWIPFIGA